MPPGLALNVISHDKKFMSSRKLNQMPMNHRLSFELSDMSVSVRGGPRLIFCYN
jgi:hypothetical protein